MPTSTGVKVARAGGASAEAEAAKSEANGGQGGEERQGRTPLDDLADHLAQLDALDANRRVPTS